MTVSTSMLDAALELAGLGLEVFPLQTWAKIPLAGTQGFKDATSDPDQIRRWWHPTSDLNIGLRAGHYGDRWLVVIDLDEHTPGISGNDAWHQLCEQHGPPPDTVEAITPSNGRHLFYWAPTRVTNAAGTNMPPGIDVRGEGGYVVVAPSRLIADRPYLWEASSDPTDGTPIADTPDWLLTLLTATPPRQEPRQRADTKPWDGPARPGDQWAAAVSWTDLLTAAGATYLATRTGTAGTYEMWARPGCMADHGELHTGATLGYGGTDLLKVHTSAWPHLTEGETYTKLGFFAATQHGGDHRLAAQALRRLGWGEEAELRFDTTTPATTVAEWPDPEPLPDEYQPPPFPVDTLPPWIADHCRQVAERLQVPIDAPAMMALGALSAIAVGHVNVRLGPTWSEPAHLYLAVVMRPGAGKSPTEKQMIAPIRSFEAARIAMLAQDVEQARHKRRVAEKRLSGLMNKAATSADAASEAWALQRQLAAEEEPQEFRLICSDVTPEKLAQLMEAHNGRLALISTEGEIFDQVLGAYSSAPNINVFLKGWSGDELVVDRKGSAGSPGVAIRIPEALLSVAVMVQPAVIDKVRGTEADARGFIDRFMVAVPSHGLQEAARRLQAVNTDTERPYRDRMLALAEQWASWLLPGEVTVPHPVGLMLTDWMDALQAQTIEELHTLTGWASKAAGSIARLAALLHLADGNPTSVPLDAATMERAIAVGDYWLAHALRVYGVHGRPDWTRGAERLLKWIRAEQHAEFPVRDAYRLLRSAFAAEGTYDKVEAVKALLEEMESLGWLRGAPPAVGQRGRPSPTVEVHPALIDGALPWEATRHARQKAFVDGVLARMARSKSSSSSSSSSLSIHANTHSPPHGHAPCAPEIEGADTPSRPEHTATPPPTENPWAALEDI